MRTSARFKVTEIHGYYITAQIKTFSPLNVAQMILFYCIESFFSETIYRL